MKRLNRFLLWVYVRTNICHGLVMMIMRMTHPSKKEYNGWVRIS